LKGSRRSTPSSKRIRDEAKRINLDKLTMDEIDAEIAVFRFEKRLNF